ncbi:MAG TPA: TonB-dependent receptor [Cyanobacteria bacterium UBA11369]|nr:TonB-dependent receptor [Cyanobacteria bacterium UBA11371]HBE34034.1 TonB-dependent receptor [Cyanobacteria bacterium UBA11368]HBE54309.1 TonB-dependent receptor [Cyanobacteria bacterium UBA11369]
MTAVAVVVVNQPAQAQVSQVTKVRLNPTPSGIEVILETSDGKPLQTFSGSYGQTFFTDAITTRLSLPEGKLFRANNPAPGIASVTVAPLDANSIRVTIVSNAGVPTGRVSAGDRGLVVSVSPTDQTAIQPTPSLPTTQPPGSEATIPAVPTPPTGEIPTVPSQAGVPSQPTPPMREGETPTVPVTPTVPAPQVPSTSDRTTPAPDRERSLEIVVTAEKTPENVQDVPLSITVLPRQELEDAQVNSLNNVAANTPNFSFFRGSNPFPFYSIRGLSNSNFLSRDPVGFYIDDVPYDYGFFLDQNLIDLERVEVLRGPQSTLYGRNSQAGVVNIITRAPTNDREFQIGGSYGNHNNRSAQLSFSDDIVRDRLFFRLAGGYTARDGFTENTLLDENVGDRSNLTGRGQLLWTPSKEWNISFNTTASYSDNGATITVPLSQSDPSKIAQDFDGFSELSSNSQALRIAYGGSGVRVTSITSRRFSDYQQQDDADSTADDLLRVINSFNSTVWSQEFRIQSPENANQFRWLLGGYFESRGFNVEKTGLRFSAAGAAGFGLPNGGEDLTSAELDQTTYAGFGQIDYNPIEPLTLTAGLRYESSTTRMDRERNFFPEGSSSPLPLGTTFNDVEENSNEWLPRFALEYRFGSNLMAYGSVTRGFKPGGLNFQTDSADLVRYEPETSWSYEVGLKSSWFNDRLIANLAAFSTLSDNYQVLLSNFTGSVSNIVNAEVRIYGVELEMRARPVVGLDLIAGFGYVNAQFTDYTNPFTGQEFKDNRLPYAPEFTYNLAVQYRTANGFLGRVDLNGFGTYFFEDANKLKQPPFALVNARIGYEGNNYGIYLFANNLFDTEYLTTAFEILQPVGTYGDRRTFGFQVRANF